MDALLADPLDLTGRVALVTGGSGGIGRAIVALFLARGATVATTFVPGVEDAEAVRASFGEVPAASGASGAAAARLSVHALDLRSGASVRACVAAAHAAHGRLDVLVNNAAVGSATVAAWTDDADAQDAAMLAINADGTLKACQAFLALPPPPDGAPHSDGDAAPSRPRWPRKLINVSSVGGGIAVFPGFRASDGMSKAAVACLSRQLAAECAHRAVDVFAVCPGATDTPMFRASSLDPLPAAERAAFLRALPKGRLIAPEEVAAVVNFLAGGASTVLNGAVIDASMGLGVRPGIMTEMEH